MKIRKEREIRQTTLRGEMGIIRRWISEETNREKEKKKNSKRGNTKQTNLMSM
jgi:hypothetical protein